MWPKVVGPADMTATQPELCNETCLTRAIKYVKINPLWVNSVLFNGERLPPYGDIEGITGTVHVLYNARQVNISASVWKSPPDDDERFRYSIKIYPRYKFDFNFVNELKHSTAELCYV